jgi:hypothetical protein
MANETISANTDWKDMASAKAFDNVITINNGATLTIDRSTIDAQGLADLAVGVKIDCTAGFSKLRLVNESTSQSMVLYGPYRGNWQFKQECELVADGNYITIYTGNGNASQTTTGWTAVAGYNAKDEPGTIEVETGSGTGVYEIWLNIGDLALSDIGCGELGKWFSYNNSTGVITFGDGGASVGRKGGAVVPNNAKVRVYNIGFGTVISNGTRTIHPALGDDVAIDLGNGGIVTLAKCYMFGVDAPLSRAKRLNFSHVGFTRCSYMDNCFGCTFDYMGIGIDRYISTHISPIQPQYSDSLTFTNCKFCNQDGDSAIYFYYLFNVSIDNCEFYTIKRNSTNDCAIYMNFAVGCTITNSKVIGAQFKMENSSNISMQNIKWSDSPHGLAYGSYDSPAIGNTNCANVTIDNLSLSTDGYTSPKSQGVIQKPSLVKNSTLNVLSDYAIRADWPALSKFVRCTFSGYTTGLLYSGFGVPIQVILQNVKTALFNSLLFQSQGCPYFSIFKGVDCTPTNPIPENIGVAYNTHFYEIRTAATSGLMGVLFNPYTPSYTQAVISGDVKFNLNGAIFINSAGGYIEFTWPHWILGITAFPAGGAVNTAGTNPGNFTLQYQIDLGSGYSDWRSLTIANLDDHSINSTTGFRFKVRVSHASGSKTDFIRLLNWSTTVDSTILYPLDEVTVTLQNVKNGSRWWLYNNTTAQVIASGTQSGTGNIVVTNVPYNGSAELLTIRVRKGSATPYYKPYETNAMLTSTGATVWVAQESDLIII